MEVSAQLLAALTQEKYSVTHFKGGWVGSGADPGGFAEGKNFPLAGIEQRTVQHAVTLDKDYVITGPLIFK